MATPKIGRTASRLLNVATRIKNNRDLIAEFRKNKDKSFKEFDRTKEFSEAVIQYFSHKEFNDRRLKYNYFDSNFERLGQDLKTWTQADDWTNRLVASHLGGDSFPEGEERPSIRLKKNTGGPIYENWLVLKKTAKAFDPVHGEYRTTTWQIENAAKHINWLEYGTKQNYDIPKNRNKNSRKLRFWTGPPLKWGDNSTDGGYEVRTVVRHPGHAETERYRRYFMGIVHSKLLGIRSSTLESFTRNDYSTTKLSNKIERYARQRIINARRNILTTQ